MMVEELWCERVDREAGDRLAALLALPMPEGEYDIGSEGTFDPWGLFPLYGSYSSDFDQCAIDVLCELDANEKHRTDLAAEMFREMLCNLNLCDYGTSPRVCFPTRQFRALLPTLIERWRAYSALQWAEESPTG
jgi:hypothetical protein